MKNGLIEYANGDKAWWQNGLRHRLDGPAVERPDGYKAWYQNGKRHRLDGPAIEWASGSKFWYFFGIQAKSEEEFYDENWRKECLLRSIK